MPEHRPGITVTKRTGRSICMLIVHSCVKPFNSQLTKVRKEYPAGSNQLEVPKKVRKKCDVRERMIEGIRVYDIIPRNAEGRPVPTEKKGRKRVYWFAGGGWQMPPSSEHWALFEAIARRLPDTTFSAVSYPLAPNSAAPVALPELSRFYRRLLQDAEEAGDKVILGGDSAGGNIMLSLTLCALHEDPDSPCPSALMALSPSTDLTRSNPDIEAYAEHDPILTVPFIKSTAKAWRQDMDATDPRVSPLYQDVTPLARRGVRVHGLTGGYDMLTPDAIRFREKCTEAGVAGEWLHWEKQMHVFPLLCGFGLPEGKAGMEWVVDVLKRC
ncbi:hypothetical protein BAUCODRAFT_74858 [Baudoinia panamericana UAMH 10762]|uniref:Alpha/beta hydrolase fold-3 domain-containing protein n=1 Tax=Baudoinia panamericana (strain UAMH 10762) TaxID=717646 RepID=M2LI86_BAUPA|nr:uncharacterized protein BAUCODRAFT_74858 [Baudoinia panamericana UAMH 10762]EMC93887.1 hypothetical protein BAUCODRAFT_74858 [Baudoinia panamericana UAMH 10762]